MKIRTGFTVLCLFIALGGHFALADTPAAKPAPCKGADRACLLQELGAASATISESDWRDQTYREYAKLLTRQGQPDEAIALLAKIAKPDTRAMTIRGIGMAAAAMKWKKADYDALFTKLRAEADKIDYAPSHAIALTYIASAQANAGDNEGAMKTAAGMDNREMRNKAYKEFAETQAQRDDLDAALKSVAAIDDPGYRDKAEYVICTVFADDKKYDEAVTAADKIVNAYQRSQAILYILAKQMTPDEVLVMP